MLCRAMLPELVVAWLALTSAVATAERCMVTDPTGSPLNVRRFDGKVIGALHNGEIVKMSPMRRTEKVGFIGRLSAATEPDRWGPEAPTSADDREIENWPAAGLVDTEKVFDETGGCPWEGCRLGLSTATKIILSARDTEAK
jgi:hypothetical protein